MAAAATNLTPVTLELGGKSPVIVDRTANIPLTAKRLAFGKLLNAGQTCVAPDYCLVDRTARDRLVEELKKQFQKMLGEDPLANRDFVRIINRKHYNRLQGLLEGENLLYGGGHRDDPDSDSGWIAPTLVADTLEGTSKPMGEEIFGPILPIIPYDTLDQAIDFFRQAIELDNGFGKAYGNLGLAYQKAGNTAESIWANRKAIALATGTNAATVRAGAYYNIARIYEAAGQFPDALRHYQLAKEQKANPVYDTAIERVQNR